MNELEYPVFMENITTGTVVCFSSEKTGHVVIGNEIYNKGHYSSDFIPANNSGCWKPYNPPLFKDGTIVWCWDDEEDTPLIVRRYDAVNAGACFADGYRGYKTFDNYKLFEGELPFELPPIKD